MRRFEFIRVTAFGLLVIVAASYCRKDSSDEEASPQPVPNGGNGDAESGSGDDDHTAPPATTPTPGTDERSPGLRSAPLFGTEGVVTSANGVFTVKADWLVGPRSGDESQLRLSLANADRMRADEDLIPSEVLPWMTTMGHGQGDRATRVTSLPAADGGKRFQVEVGDIYFIMPGPWDIFVTATVGGRTDRATIHLNVP